MPKIICECGEILRYSLIPNPIEWLTIDKSQFYNFWYKDLKDELYMAFKSLLHCNNCGRLSFFVTVFKQSHIYTQLKNISMMNLLPINQSLFVNVEIK